MLNILWRFLLTIIFIASNLMILILVWKIPEFLGLQVPDDLRNLLITFLTFISLVSGVWGTWTRSHPKKEKIVERAVISKEVKSIPEIPETK